MKKAFLLLSILLTLSCSKEDQEENVAELKIDCNCDVVTVEIKYRTTRFEDHNTTERLYIKELSREADPDPSCYDEMEFPEFSLEPSEHFDTSPPTYETTYTGTYYHCYGDPNPQANYGCESLVVGYSGNNQEGVEEFRIKFQDSQGDIRELEVDKNTYDYYYSKIIARDAKICWEGRK